MADMAFDYEILGERYNEYTGFECDDYDPYDPFDGDDGRDDYWRDSAEQAGWFDENGDWHPFDEESEA